MTIRPLNHPAGYGDADTPFGHYRVGVGYVDLYGASCRLTFASREIMGPYATTAEAWATASADYERRVRACLVDTTQTPTSDA
jgi:hypothetical protein